MAEGLRRSRDEARSLAEALERSARATREIADLTQTISRTAQSVRDPAPAAPDGKTGNTPRGGNGEVIRRLDAIAAALNGGHRGRAL